MSFKKPAGAMTIFSIYAILLAAGFTGLVIACVSDVKERLIYNEIVLFVLGTGVALRLISTPKLVWISLLVSATLLVLLGQCARFNMMGGGDAKLIAATGWLLPPQDNFWLLAHIAVAGGALSCIYLLTRTVLRRAKIIPARPEQAFPMGGSSQALANEFAKISAGEPMPYALAILAGTSYSIADEVIRCGSAISCSL